MHVPHSHPRLLGLPSPFLQWLMDFLPLQAGQTPVLLVYYRAGAPPALQTAPQDPFLPLPWLDTPVGRDPSEQKHLPGYRPFGLFGFFSAST